MKIVRNLSKKYILKEGEKLEYDINSLEDLMNLLWVKEVINSNTKYHLSKSSMSHEPDYLMVLSNINGQVNYNVLAYIYGDGTKLGLKYY